MTAPLANVVTLGSATCSPSGSSTERGRRGEPDPGRGGVRFTIGIMADSADEVDDLAARFRQFGGQLTKERVNAEFFEGQSALRHRPVALPLNRPKSPPDPSGRTGGKAREADPKPAGADG
jgi:hypothetical protein